ncbi:hypothetical protein EMPS_09797 [Entomortierella parvispora]|uniref:Uncharacterized protein n=1 Tax=Entomortierella parvispora TaxID=205924 RepID=A0A9P3M0N1_9FUNG|nr:hypothetical protein EMPS_09797 [Entomortierella parvispora]
MSSRLALQTPPSSPQPFEEQCVTSNECQQHTNNAEEDGIDTSQTPPSTPLHESDNVGLHGTENDSEKKTVDTAFAAGADKAQDEQTFAKEDNDILHPSGATASRGSALPDTKAGHSSESLEPSETEEKKEIDQSPAIEIEQPSKKPEKPTSPAEESPQSLRLIRVINDGCESSSRYGRPRCQATTLRGTQCLSDASCSYARHPAQNRFITWQNAIDNRDPSLCRGITQLMTLCKNEAETCQHQEHRDQRKVTKGDIFRAHISNHTRTREELRLYYIADRPVDIKLVEGWYVGAREPDLLHELVPQDLYPSRNRYIRDCIDSFVKRVEEITSSYPEYIRRSILYTIHQHLTDLNTSELKRNEDKTLWPFRTGYVYFTIYNPSYFQYYDKNLISNQCVVIKKGVCKDVHKRFKGPYGP